MKQPLKNLAGKFHCGDAYDFMEEHIPLESLDLVVTSPPYNLLNTDRHGPGPPHHWATGAGVRGAASSCPAQ